MAAIGDMWDSTTDVLAGRSGPLAWFGALGIVLPVTVQNAVALYGGRSAGAAVLGLLVGLGAVLLVIWALLAIVAVASDHATTRSDAGRAATGRVPAALLVVLVAIAASIVAALPMGVAIVASGYDLAAASAARDAASMPPIPRGTAQFVSLYSLLFSIAAIWVSARLFVLWPVLVVERRGVGAFARSWALTRGHTWKLVGVSLLFSIVWGIAATAAQAVVGVFARLLLGADGQATSLLLAGIAWAAVTAAFIVVVQVFATRLHATLAAGEGQAAS